MAYGIVEIIVVKGDIGRCEMKYVLKAISEKCIMKYVLKAISEKCIWLILILALGIMGCVSATTSYSSKLRITPLSNQNTINLRANDIVQMMRRVGFSDEQILELGTDMRDSLSHSGAAQLEISDKVEAIFAVNNDFVYIATRLRGSFIYNVKTGRILSSAL